MDLLQPSTVLLADDDAPSRYAAAHALRRAGYMVQETGLGTEALELIRRQPPDLVVLDVGLPGLPGREVLRQIKANPATAHLPVMYLSATYPEDTDVAAGLEEGADSYLTKPVAPEVLVAQAQALLRLGEAQKDLLVSRREAERLLQETEQQRGLLETVIEQMAAGLSVVDASGQVVLTNEKARAILGPSALQPDVEGRRRAMNTRYADGRPCPADEAPGMRSVRRGEVVAEEEMLVTRGDGSEAILLVSSSPLHDREGAVTGAVVSYRDVTRHRWVEAAAEEAAARYAAILGTMRSGYWLFDTEGKLLEVNDAYCHMSGYRRAELLRMSVPDLEANETAEEVLRHIRLVCEQGHDQFESRHRRKDGTLFDVDIRASYLAAGGRLVVFIWDITESKRAEQALRESEERFRVLSEAMPQIVWSATASGAMDYCNQRALEYGGLGPGDAQAWNWVSVVHPEDRRATRRVWRRALKTGQPYEIEQRLRRADGVFRWHLARGLPIRDTEGRIVRWIGTATDIQDMKATEEALFQANQHLRWLVDALPVGISFSEDPHAGRITGNPACAAQFEFAPGDNFSASAPEQAAAGRQVRFFQEGRELDSSELPLQRALAENREIAPVELEVVLPSGRRWFAGISGAPIRDSRGSVVAGVAVSVDITQRHLLEEAEQAAAAQARLVETIQESVPQAMAYCDRELHFLSVSGPYVRAFGLRKEDLLGRTYPEVFPSRHHMIAALRQVIDSGEPVRLTEFADAPHRQADLGVHYHDASFTPVLGAQGDVEGVVFSVSDVTERVQQRERLLAAERARAAIAEHLSDEIAHRVKNNLAMISGLLQMQMLSARGTPTAAALRDAVGRIRTFASLHERMCASQSETVDLLEALRQIGDTTSQVFAERRDVEIIVRGASHVCTSRVATNLSVIANELITNALKYGAPEAEGRLRVCVDLEAGEDGVRISVWNSGCPIAGSFDPRVQRNMGLRLVWDVVVEQYRGHFHLRPHEDGTLAEVFVPQHSLSLDDRSREGECPL